METEEEFVYIKIVNGHEMEIFLIMNYEIDDVDAMAFKCLTCSLEENDATMLPINSVEDATSAVRQIDEHASAHARKPL